MHQTQTFVHLIRLLLDSVQMTSVRASAFEIHPHEDSRQLSICAFNLSAG